MKKILLILLTVILCCSIGFAKKEGISSASLVAEFGLDKNSFTFHKGEILFSADYDTVNASVGYRFISNEELLKNYYEHSYSNTDESGLFANVSVKVTDYFEVNAQAGYRLYDVLLYSFDGTPDSKAEYKGSHDYTFKNKGFYANVGTIANIVTHKDDDDNPDRGFTLKTGVSTEFMNNELNLAGVNMSAIYNASVNEHKFYILSGTFIATDKDSSGKLFKTSSKTIGGFGYSYDEKYFYQFDSSYFKSYTDSSVEDGLYTRNSFGWVVSNENWWENVVSFFKLSGSVSTWSPKENGELTLSRLTTNSGLDLALVKSFGGGSGYTFTFNSDSYYNSFVDNKEENYFYGETDICFNQRESKDFSYGYSINSDHLVNKVDSKVSVADANYLATINVNYCGADWTLNLDYEHSDDNNPEKNRLLTNFEAGYSLPTSLVRKAYINNLRVNAGVNGKYYLQNGSYSKGEYNGYSGTQLVF